jgi:hypothetical protein
MVELEKYFIQRDKNNQQGIEYLQISSTDNAYLYKKIDLTNNQTSYLTFKRIEDNIIDRVKFPQNHNFEEWAFEYAILNNAIVKFVELNCNK